MGWLFGALAFVGFCLVIIATDSDKLARGAIGTILLILCMFFLGLLAGLDTTPVRSDPVNIPDTLVVTGYVLEVDTVKIGE